MSKKRKKRYARALRRWLVFVICRWLANLAADLAPGLANAMPWLHVPSGAAAATLGSLLIYLVGQQGLSDLFGIKGARRWPRLAGRRRRWRAGAQAIRRGAGTARGRAAPPS